MSSTKGFAAPNEATTHAEKSPVAQSASQRQVGRSGFGAASCSWLDWDGDNDETCHPGGRCRMGSRLPALRERSGGSLQLHFQGQQELGRRARVMKGQQ